jgi:hypothetical protein
MGRAKAFVKFSGQRKNGNVAWPKILYLNIIKIKDFVSKETFIFCSVIFKVLQVMRSAEDPSEIAPDMRGNNYKIHFYKLVLIIKNLIIFFLLKSD